ncbi:MAG: OadG family protein [Lachnospiraceae bacterium]|nr:OadG family protein [Lachnospiraceae bacterium]
MKKKLLSLACVLVVAFSLAACGSSTGEQTYGGYKAEDLQAQSQQIVEQYIASTSADDAAANAAQLSSQAKSASTDQAATYKLLATMYDNWAETSPVVGRIQGYGDFKVDKTGKTLTTTQYLMCENRDAKLSVVYTVYNMKISSVNIEPLYTMGETLRKAGLNVLIGICTVFVMLVLISLLISCFKIIPYIQGKMAKKEAPSAESVSAPAAAAAPSVQNENNEELVAVIAAAIAASTGESTDSFVVRSIRRRYL